MKINLFIAAVPSHDNRQLIAQKIHQCEAKRSSQIRINWTYLTDLHVTMGFLSGVETNDAQALAQGFTILKDTTKFLATVKDVRIYGNAIVLRLEPYQTFLGLFKKLKNQLQTVLDNKYHFKEHARFDAHLTIGRIQSPRVLNTTQQYQLTAMISEQFVNASFLIQQTALMQRIPENIAKMSKSAQVYQVLQGYPFK